MAYYVRAEIVAEIRRLHAEKVSIRGIARKLRIDPATVRRYLLGGEMYEDRIGPRRDATELDRLIRLQREDDSSMLVAYDRTASPATSLDVLRDQQREPAIHMGARHLIAWSDPTADAAIRRMEWPHYLEDIAAAEDEHGLTVLDAPVPDEMHGTLSGFRRKCRCRPCADAWNAYNRAYRASRRVPGAKQKGVRTHGKVSTYNTGCRCDECKSAAQSRRQRERDEPLRLLDAG